MKRLTAALCIAFFFGQLQAASILESKDKAAEQEGLALIRQFTAAQKNYDASTMNQILAPDYVEISPVGEVDSRAKVLSFYTPEEKKNFPGELLVYDLDEMSLRRYGNISIVVARLRVVMKNKEGQTSERALRCVFVCRKQQDRWQLVSAQYTNIAEHNKQKS